jgi:hypothetical protein
MNGHASVIRLHILALLSYLVKFDVLYVFITTYFSIRSPAHIPSTLSLRGQRGQRGRWR